MEAPAVGNHGITYRNIFNLVYGLFGDTFVQRVKNDYAARILFISQGLSIKNSMFTKVVLGDDIDVLIVPDYLGNRFSSYPYDVCVVNNRITFFIFSDCLKNDNYSTASRVANIYNLINALIMLGAKSDILNISGSIYQTITYYAPMVMTIRLFNLLNDSPFDYNKDYDPALMDEYVTTWFTEEACTLINNTKYTDSDFLEFGLLVEYVTEGR